MSYSANQRATYARLADHADQLLRGAKAADLPIEPPARFELVLNTGTARRLGLAIPPSITPSVDRLVE